MTSHPQSRLSSSSKTHQKSVSFDDSLMLVKETYSLELSQLMAIYSDTNWSEIDLLTVLDEVGGDLEVAISRISEGFAHGWDEVKNPKKKEKKNVPSKPVDEPTSTPLGSDRGTRSDRGATRGTSTRGGRGGFRGGRGGSRGGFSNGTGTSRPQKSEESNANSWGSSEAVVETSIETTVEESTGGWGDSTQSTGGWGESTPKATVNKPVKAQAVSKPAQTAQAVSKPAQAAPVHSTPSKPATSWAQLVKGSDPPPPVVVVEPVVEKLAPPPSPKKKAASPLIAPATPIRASSPIRDLSPIRAPSPARARSRSPAPTSPLRGHEAEAPPTAPVEVVRTRSKSPAKSPRIPVPHPITALTADTETTSASDSHSQNFDRPPPGFKPAVRSAPQRVLKQDAPVIMPSANAISSIGVQFGSFNINSQEDETSVQDSAATNNIPSNSAIGTKPSESNQAAPPTANNLHRVNPVTQAPVAGLPYGMKPEQGHIGAQFQNTSLPSAVGVSPYSYFPQQIASQQQLASGLGFGPLGSVPADYSNIYGSDARMMGYYAQDPNTAYAQVPAAKFPAGETGVNASQTSPQQAGQQGQPTSQPPYAQAVPYGYYPYFLPNHQYGNPYGAPQPYGAQQNYVNKSLYTPYAGVPGQAAPVPVANPKSGLTGNSYGSYAQPQIYQGYEDLGSNLASQDYKQAGSNMYMPQQSFGGFGSNVQQSHQQGPSQMASQGKVQSSAASQSSGSDYKSQSREPRQAYGSQKYPSNTNPASSGSNQANIPNSQSSATGSGSVGNSGSSANGVPSAGGYGGYQQPHHVSQQQQQGHLGYPNHLMQQQQQQQHYQSGGYQQRQQGQYWNGQN